jgi:hypothetical protein
MSMDFNLARLAPLNSRQPSHASPSLLPLVNHKTVSAVFTLTLIDTQIRPILNLKPTSALEPNQLK